MEDKLHYVSISEIHIEERARKDYKDLEELKKSMTNEGLIHPIAVMELEKGWQLLAGGRRLAAAKELNWTSISCHIYPFTDDERKRKLIELSENIHRENLAYDEEAKLIREIHNLQVDIKGIKMGKGLPEGHSLADTAKMLGLSKSAVHLELKLADAMDKDPELANFKTKGEAISHLYKQQEKVYLNELSKRATEKATTSLDKAQQTIINSYIIGDVLKELKSLESNMFSFAEIDPPYAIELRKVVVTTKEETELLRAGKLSDEDKAAYVKWLSEVIKEIYRVMKPNSWVILWYAIDPWHQTMCELLSNAGFTGAGVPALWVKNNGNTRTPNVHLSNYYEPFLYARKGNAMLARPGSRNVFQFPVVPSKTHPNEKPIEMYMDILKIFCVPGSAVLSAFAGSGNCLLAASNLQMPVVGFDLDSDARSRFVARVYETKPGEYRTYR